MAAIVKVEESAAVDLGFLLDAGDGAMVTLVAGETQLAAHWAVLEARIPVLTDLLGSGGCRISINMPDMEGAVLRQLLSYLYTLQAPQLPDLASHLLPVAHRFGVSGLKAHCERQVAAELDVENAASAAVLAVEYDCPDLTVAAVDFIRANPQVMATRGWADAVLTQPEQVVEVSRLLANPPADADEPATKSRRTTPGGHHQNHTDGGHQPPTAAAAPMASHHTPALPANAISRLGRLTGDERGTKLIQAATQGAVEEMRALMALGVEVYTYDGVGRTALHWAASEGHVEAARCLVEGGASVNATTHRGQDTPLHVAVVSGHIPVVRYLLAAGAQCNANNSWGRTPLHWAAWCGNAEVVAALLEAGANRKLRDNNGRTPLDYARQNNKQDLIEMLTPR